MKKNKDFGVYDFSDYAEEITGDALFKINGGAEVENSHEGVANAQVGDTITRNDGTVVTLNQADIDYAQQQLGTYGNQETNNTSTGTQNYSGGSNQTVNSTNTTNEEKQSLMYDPHNPSRVIVDLDDPKAMQQAAELLADPNLGLRITAYGSESGITKNFKDYGEIIKYLGADRPRTFFDDVMDNVMYFHFEGRDKKNIVFETYEEIAKSSANNGDWMLLSEAMSIYHQNGIGSPELKFVCVDGREAVFSKDYSKDGSYELVTDARYKGTYNYCNPGSETDGVGDVIVKDLGHFFADMLPYYFTGCRNEKNQ